MEKMTGQKKMSTKALREYFEPLERWLKKENKKSGAQVGWGSVDVDAVCEQASTSAGPKIGTSSWLCILVLAYFLAN